LEGDASKKGVYQERRSQQATDNADFESIAND